MHQSNEGRSGINKIILRAIAKALRESRLPSYVYDAPVNRVFLETSKPLDNEVRGIEHQLEQLQPSFSTPNIRYQPLTAGRFVSGLSFRRQDVIHMRRAEPLGPYSQESCVSWCHR